MSNKGFSIFLAAFLIAFIVVTPLCAQLPAVSNGINYLISSQSPDGTWTTGTSEVETTASTVSVLQTFRLLNQTSSGSYVSGSSWLQAQSPQGVNAIAERLGALKTTDSSLQTLISVLDINRNAWGGDAEYDLNNLDTASALKALKHVDYSDQPLIFKVINHLLSTQNPDGGWGFIKGNDSNAEDTARVLSTLALFKGVYIADAQLASAVSYLLSNQNADGGFGAGGSTVYESALAFIAIMECGQGELVPLQNAVNYLNSTQSANGSWNDDPYSTALAIRALALVKPELAIAATDIVVSPSASTVGQNVTVTATVHNTGLEGAANVVLRLLDNGTVVSEQTIAAVGPGGTAQAVFAISAIDPAGEHVLSVVVDPANAIDETSKANNSATARIWAKTPPDLAVLPENLTISPAYPKPGDTITLTAAIANLGESAAGAFTADLYDGDPNSGGVKLGSFKLPGVAGGEWGTGTVTFSFAAEGSRTLYLVVDPQHVVNELITANNSSSKTITVSATAGSFFDLSIPMNGVQVNPARPHAGETVTVTLLARNMGAETTTADLELFDGDPATGGTLLHKSIVTLSTGETRTVSVPWQVTAGSHTLHAYLDRANAVSERDETNNSQSLTVMADMVDIEISASDIAIEPEHPMDGDPASVKVTIQNRGIKATGPFNVNLYNGDPSNGGTLLKTFPVIDLAGDASQTITYPFTAARGTYRFHAVCDPENTVTELSEDNNLAIRSLLVKTSAEAAGPDLVPLEFDFSAVTIDPQSLHISGLAKVRFQNKGDDKVNTTFRITVFEDKDGDGVYTEGTDVALGNWDYTASMNPNMVGIVNVMLDGSLTFRDAPIYAEVDSEEVVFEQDEDNNTIRKGSACEARPASPIEPVLKWKWERANDSMFGRLLSTPVVISLTDDNGDGRIDDNDRPVVLVNTRYGDYQTNEGKLWAFDGQTGALIFGRYVQGQTTSEDSYPIVGDIDGDWKPEIVFTTYYNNGGLTNLTALENDGTFKWNNAAQVTSWYQANRLNIPYGGNHDLPVLSDIDNDGHAEIIDARTVINWDGSVRCAPDYRQSSGLGWTTGFGYSNSVADLDMDGKQEIIAGNNAFNSDCTTKWYNASLPDGLTSIGNFDDDPYPEIVLLNVNGSPGTALYLLEHDGKIKWGPVVIRQLEETSYSGHGGHPVIADLDGDGKAEIGISGLNKYFILDRDGRVKTTISYPLSGSSSAVAPAVFDLDGDGRPEVLFSDNSNFMIFDGKDGTLRYKETTGFYSYYPSQSVIIADVNGDGHAEAVITGNNGYGTMSGNIRVYGAKNNDWVNTRRIWNQASYHVTNINIDGSIPQYEAPSWLLNNNYRYQVPVGTSTGNPYVAADLSASFIRTDMGNYPSSVTITARIGNGGAKAIDPGVKTSFYDGDPANGGALIGTAITTKTLNPGDFEDMSIVWNAPRERNHTIYVAADPDNTVAECDKANNTAFMATYVTNGQPDLSIAAEDVVTHSAIYEGSLTDIWVTVRNSGTLLAENILLRLYNGNPASGGTMVGERTIPSIAAGGAATLTINWNTLGAKGANYLYAVVDPTGTINESNEGSNTAIRDVMVGPADKPDLQIAAEDMVIAPASPREGDTVTINATVHNRGSQAGNVIIALYDGNPTAGGVKRGETVIPQSMANGGGAGVSFTVDTIGQAGSHTFYLHIDPENIISESEETNNQAARAITITPAWISAGITTDKTNYSANEPVYTTLTLAEQGGSARTVVYDLQVLDEKGAPAATLPESTVSLGAGAGQTVPIPWNTGATYAGPYTLTVRIKESGSNIAKASAPITIAPVKTADISVTVDKTSYSAKEPVAIVTTVTGNSPNYIFSDATATTSILDGTGQTLFSTTKAIFSLANGQRIEIRNYWNTATLAPGSYPVVTEVKDSLGVVIASASQAVTITGPTPSAALAGQVTVDKQSVMAGEQITITGNLTNKGNTDLATVTVKVLTVHTANQNVYNTLSYETALTMGASYAFTGQIDTASLSAKDYLVILRGTINGLEETIGGTYFRVEGAPSAPALAGPAEGSDVATFTPQLSVNNAADPNDDKETYQFEVYADGGLSSLVTSSASVQEGNGITAWSTSVPLTENQTYYWRARAYDGKLYGPWMTTASFRVNIANDPPTAPTIAAPADGAAVAVFGPTLTINNSSDPDSTSLTYNFAVALDPEFTNIIASTPSVASGEATTSWAVPVTLQENGWYHWRAQADDWQMEGPWSQTVRFQVNTANDAPTTPVITAPLNGSTVAALTTHVAIANSTDPDSSVITYYFEADTVSTFDSPNIIRSGSLTAGEGSTTWNLSGLSDNTRYYLRVKASDGAAESTWSETISFFANTVNDPPTTPTPANPSDGAGVNQYSPTLSVHNAADLDHDPLTYEFEVYADAALTSLVSRAAGVIETAAVTSWTVPATLAENQTYYWRARAFDGYLTSDKWTQTMSFMVNTANDAPGAPKPALPAEGSSVSTPTPTLTIANAADPDSSIQSYDFEIYAGPTLAATVTGIPQDASGLTSVTLTTPLTDNTAYQWRARAFDGALYGAWSHMASFTVHLPVTSIGATIDFDPDTLNPKSNGTWVTVRIELPEGYNPSDIDIASIRLEGAISAELRPYAVGDCDKDGIKDLMVKFRRSEVINLLPSGDRVPVHVTGKVGSVVFEGVDLIRVMQ
ncbi:CARDB domain repeat-containing isoprenoid cyclase, putative [Geotalea daltonii FRC-32]|uniref:CARDB domain repeat-containing isoprenoid cyclase, putative n=1 Tax=Geotalea daltonii (strain DSM 22248 / JCM 15807 / FRC-32) TaxID=316067 RepID=B9M1A6_GEODF|nr:CARDB domain-containing protein [Geotalea daltonii]ACM19176.1 CARDB domain repeat-containing isoprenoid cyclase, putative [Geotalea daltonii FRC-32]